LAAAANPPQPPSLAGRSLSGFLWLGGAQVLGQSLHLVLRLVLARLLAPEAFGLVAMAVVFVGLSELLIDLGLLSSVVQRRELSEAHRSTAFWFRLLAAAAAGLVLAAAARPIAALYGVPELTPVLWWLSASLVVSAPGAIAEAFLYRELDFRTPGVQTVVSVLAGGSVGIAAAALGYGVWALVADVLVRGLVGSVLLTWKLGWVPRLLWDRRALQELWAFSQPIAATRFVNFFARNTDTFLIGKFLDAAALGLYNIGYQATILPLQYLTRPLTKVLFPVLSSIQENLREARAAYVETLGAVVFAVWPFSALGLVAGPIAIPMVLGPQWQEAALPFQLLCVVGALQAPFSLTPALLVGLGRPGLQLQWNLVSTAAVISGIAAGLAGGIVGVAAGYALAVAATTPLHYRFVRRVFGGEAVPWAREYGKGLATTAALAAAWAGLAPLVAPERGPLRLAAAAVLVLAVCALISLVTFRATWARLLRTAAEMRARARAAAAEEPLA
jgi:O-antigen/teichoic acid export membrane protein